LNPEREDDFVKVDHSNPKTVANEKHKEEALKTQHLTERTLMSPTWLEWRQQTFFPSLVLGVRLGYSRLGGPGFPKKYQYTQRLKNRVRGLFVTLLNMISSHISN